MALEGSLDAFGLPDVLRLLAATAKTGCLYVGGDRASGHVWVDRGGRQRPLIGARSRNNRYYFCIFPPRRVRIPL